MLRLWTSQMCQWRKAKAQNIEFFDITLKSGNRAFAPTPNMLYNYKNNMLNPNFSSIEEEYTHLYNNLMRTTYVNQRHEWDALVDKIINNDGDMAFVCYCGADKFCHRHLFLQMIVAVLRKHGHEPVLMGEFRG